MTEIPDGVPRALRLALAAEVLELNERIVRGWVDRSKVESLSAGPGCVRYIPAREIARLADRLGLEPNWHVAIRAAEAAGSPLV